MFWVSRKHSCFVAGCRVECVRWWKQVFREKLKKLKTDPVIKKNKTERWLHRAAWKKRVAQLHSPGWNHQQRLPQPAYGVCKPHCYLYVCKITEQKKKGNIWIHLSVMGQNSDTLNYPDMSHKPLSIIRFKDVLLSSVSCYQYWHVRMIEPMCAWPCVWTNRNILQLYCTLCSSHRLSFWMNKHTFVSGFVSGLQSIWIFMANCGKRARLYSILFAWHK